MEFKTENKYENENVIKKKTYAMLEKCFVTNDINETCSTKDSDTNQMNNLEKESVSDSTQNNLNVFDVASYILKKLETISTMKLQKLIYYCQAWSLVWDEKQLFEEPIEAWANGPVVRELFFFHQGMFQISSIQVGNSDLLDNDQKETVDAVIKYYGNKKAQWLIDLTHSEEPWKKAREGLPISVRSNKKISLESMYEYYSSIKK